jgi:hypothetical protein
LINYELFVIRLGKQAAMECWRLGLAPIERSFSRAKAGMAAKTTATIRSRVK